MVVINIANIDTSIIGGVQIAVPKMVRAQSEFATVGLINTHGDAIDGVQMLDLGRELDFDLLPEPFNKPDLVIFHEVYRIEFIRIHKNVRRAGIPFIIIPHGCLSKQAQKRKFLKKFVANLLLFKGFIKAALSLQYLSEREKAQTAFPAYPSFVFGNGIEMPDRRKTEFFLSGVRIVYVGRLEITTKGLDLLLGAVKEKQDYLRREKVKFEIYGPEYEGEHTTLANMIAEYNIGDIVTVGGAKMGEEKERVLLSADCFIQTSRTEGLPMGPIEALAYGLPLIITDGVGLGDIVESYGAGYRCETSTEGIAEAIEKFVNNRDKIELTSREAVRLAEERFNSATVAKAAIDVYSRMVKR